MSEPNPMPDDTLTLYVITKQPRDFPDSFVVRRQFVRRGNVEYERAATICQSLEQARKMIPPGLFNLGRHVDDDPVIAEVWI